MLQDCGILHGHTVTLAIQHCRKYLDFLDQLAAVQSEPTPSTLGYGGGVITVQLAFSWYDLCEDVLGLILTVCRYNKLVLPVYKEWPRACSSAYKLSLRSTGSTPVQPYSDP